MWLRVIYQACNVYMARSYFYPRFQCRAIEKCLLEVDGSTYRKNQSDFLFFTT